MLEQIVLETNGYALVSSRTNGLIGDVRVIPEPLDIHKTQALGDFNLIGSTLHAPQI